MYKATADADPASILFNLPGYRVIDVHCHPDGTREVLVETGAVEAACPACGVLTCRVHQRTRQRIRDVPMDGLLTVWWFKKRWRCAEPACGKRTFTESTDQVPPRARVTKRLKDKVVDALAGEPRAVDRVAGEHGLSWPTVMRQLSGARARQVARQEDRPRLVVRLGIDEHRFRSVRWYRDEAGGWRRIEPWMVTFTDLTSGNVIGMVDGRDSKAVKSWLETRPRWWRHRVRVVAINRRRRSAKPSATYCRRRG